MIDLHCHSFFSDGTLSPADLLKKAEHAQVTMLALTDHDTVDGVYQLLKLDIPENLRFIPGIELSTRWKKYDVHILGLGLDPLNPELKKIIALQTASRHSRSQQLALRLQALGIENALAKARLISGHDRIGRPHFAQVLVDEKRVSDRAAAFRQILGRGRPGYVVTNWIDIEQAVTVIHQAGGKAVIAHPLKYQLTRTKLQELITHFKEVGGDGLEVVSGEITQSQIQEVAGLCARYNLSASTGSDYHGDGISRVMLGKQRLIPAHCLPVWQQWSN